MIFTYSDKEELRVAKSLLETPGLVTRLNNLVGKRIEKGFELLPDDWNEGVAEVTQAALLKAADVAIFTMKDIPGEAPTNLWHKGFVAVAGAGGGFFGLTGLAIELPISTTIMLRSIADIARGQGESISSIKTKMACLEVFALGGKSESDAATESDYYSMRFSLARAVTKATEFLAKGLAPKTANVFNPKAAPPLIRVVTKIAERFSIQITQKTAAQAAPYIGAAGGAIINTMFMDHFQDIAKGHFIVRKLERKYGQERVKELYESLAMPVPV